MLPVLRQLLLLRFLRRVLLPFLWIERVFSLLFASKEKINNIKSEVENINNISYEEVELGKAVFNKFGLDYRQY